MQWEPSIDVRYKPSGWMRFSVRPGLPGGPIRNAYDPRHASGSSGSTGSGVAANFAAVGIGEDTGGSVRGPAAGGALVG
jgi:Asp-tRNA(Asn)/Glu-tRNA(Gln) amidotransferase A subunit family amidase